jgi:hypothetical protein
MKKLLWLSIFLMTGITGFSQEVTNEYLMKRIKEVSEKTYSISEQKKALGTTEEEYMAGLVIDRNMTIEAARYRVNLLYVDYEDVKAGREKTSIRLMKSIAEKSAKAEAEKQAKAEARKKDRYEYFYKYFPELLSLYEKYSIVDNITRQMESKLMKDGEVNRELAKTFNWLEFGAYQVKDSKNASGYTRDSLYIYPNLEAFIKDVSEYQIRTEPSLNSRMGTGVDKEYYEIIKNDPNSSSEAVVIKGYPEIWSKIKIAVSNRIAEAKAREAEAKAKAEAERIAKIVAVQDAGIYKLLPELRKLFKSKKIKNEGVMLRFMFAVTNYGFDTRLISGYNLLGFGKTYNIEPTTSTGVDVNGYYIYNSLADFISDVKVLQSAKNTIFVDNDDYVIHGLTSVILGSKDYGASSAVAVQTIQNHMPTVFDHVDKGFIILGSEAEIEAERRSEAERLDKAVQIQEAGIYKLLPELKMLFKSKDIKYEGTMLKFMLALTDYGVDTELISTNNLFGFGKTYTIESTASSGVSDKGYYVYKNLTDFVTDLKAVQQSMGVNNYSEPMVEVRLINKLLDEDSKLISAETIKYNMPAIFDHVDDNFIISGVSEAERLAATVPVQESGIIAMLPELKKLFVKHKIECKGVVLRFILVITNYGLDTELLSTNNLFKLGSTFTVKGKDNYTYKDLNKFVADLKQVQIDNPVEFSSDSRLEYELAKRFLNGNDELLSIRNIENEMPTIFNYIDRNFNIK